MNGGQKIEVSTPINEIPVFVKGGSIIPFGEPVQYTGQTKNEKLKILIYAGADGNFELYEDEGDTYNYKDGKYSIIPFEWNDRDQILKIEARKGNFEGMLEERNFQIILIKDTVKRDKLKKVELTYTGKKISLDNKTIIYSN